MIQWTWTYEDDASRPGWLDFSLPNPLPQAPQVSIFDEALADLEAVAA